MHKLFFDRNSIVEIRYDSTERLVAVACQKELLDYDKNALIYTPCKVGFISLPGNFFDPKKNCIEKCTLFKESAWIENGIILIETKKFTECILIWRLKQWLENSTKPYPIECKMINPPCGIVETCPCRNIFRVASFMSESSVQRLGLENIRSQKKVRLHILPTVSRVMLRFCNRLINEQEIVSLKRSENVLFAMKLRLLADKFSLAYSCLAKYEFSKTRGRAIGNPWVEL